MAGLGWAGPCRDHCWNPISGTSEQGRAIEDAAIKRAGFCVYRHQRITRAGGGFQSASVTLITGNPDCAARSTLETLGSLVFVFLRTEQNYGL